jgi:hypothetical protein
MPRGIEVTQARAGRAKSQLPVAVAASRTVKTRFNPGPEPPFWAAAGSVVVMTLVVQIWPFGVLGQCFGWCLETRHVGCAALVIWGPCWCLCLSAHGLASGITPTSAPDGIRRSF